jgi:O-antigen/teichoic acid export membrane protein
MGNAPLGRENRDNEQHFRTDHLLSNLGSRAFSGGIVTTASQATRLGLYMVLTVLLARILTPRDFGLVAMALALTQVLHLFREAGLSTATVQQQTITHAQVSNLFWINVAVGLVCTLVGTALAPVMAWFYRDERLLGITILLSLTLLTGGAAVQHLALLNRQMRFKALALIDVASMLACLIVALVMAAGGCGYWSLVGSQLAAALTELVLAWAASGWRPQMPKVRSGTRSMFNFGASITFATLLRRITSNADSFLLGRYFGADALGLYSRGMALIMRPLDQFLVPFDKVFVPVLSRLQDRPEQYRAKFLQIYNAMALVSFPIAGLFLGLAGPIVLVALGPRWAGVTPIFAALALASLYYPVAGASMWLLTTQRRNRDILSSGVAISLISIASCLAGLAYGPVGVALAFSLFGILIRLPVQYHIVGRSGPVSRADLWKVCLRHLPFWAAAAAGSYLPQQLLPQTHPLLQAGFGTVMGILAALMLAWSVPSYRQEVRQLVDLVRRLVLRPRDGKA